MVTRSLVVTLLNILAKNINNKQHIFCILLLVMLTCFLRTYLHIPTYCGQLCLFVALYMIAAYVRIYGLQRWQKKDILLTLAIISMVTVAHIYATNKIYAWLGSDYLYNTLVNFAISKESLPVLLISVLLFTLFLKCNFGRSKFINYLATCTLGVYLFHEHPLMRDFIWQKLLHTADASFGEHPFLHCIGAIVGIYIAGTLFDIIWQQPIGRLYHPLEHYIIQPIYIRVKKLGNDIIQSIIG